jgi:hypothetical protein
VLVGDTHNLALAGTLAGFVPAPGGAHQQSQSQEGKREPSDFGRPRSSHPFLPSSRQYVGFLSQEPTWHAIVMS